MSDKIIIVDESTKRGTGRTDLAAEFAARLGTGKYDRIEKKIIRKRFK